MPSLELKDARLAYERRGMGPLVVFLHGVGSTKETWTGQLRRFGRGHLAAALDLRGHGGSTCDPSTISLEAFAADTAALIGHLAAGPAHVCGLSMGGIVALQLWRDRPDVVRSLVLCDTWAFHPEAAAGQEARLRAIDGSGMEELARARMPLVYAPAAPAELVERGVAVMAAKDKAAYRRSSEVLWRADMRSVAAGVRVPALVLVGAEDRITPVPLSEELARLIPGARLAVIEGAGHLTNEERPADFNRALAQHLATFQD
ncbi:MAG TPA: alpha/beta fold hydrolase [Candidatus Acidoferrales bacterium]|nr:alpha/beta fold hydrolase [Candidatus Acidoferrales bacterium]